jgi:hypothetical protein
LRPQQAGHGRGHHDQGAGREYAATDPAQADRIGAMAQRNVHASLDQHKHGQGSE